MDTDMYYQEVENMNSEGCALYPCSKPKKTSPLFPTGTICLSIMSASSGGKNTPKRVHRPPAFWDYMAHVHLENTYVTQKLCH